MIVCGIDPGLSGAICFYNTIGMITDIVDIPTFVLPRGGKNKREVDAAKLAAAFSFPVGHAFVEQVASMPGQGVSSVFAFGKTYGIILGVLAARGVPISFVAPRVWKKGLGVPAAKDGARARASQLMPAESARWARAKDDGRAEAALIAVWGVKAMNAIANAA